MKNLTNLKVSKSADIILLTDYRNQFYFSTKSRGGSMDLRKLSKNFKNQGLNLIVKKFSDIDFRNENYEGKHIIYQSSEDPSLSYKDYIQDILLALHFQGAILIPSIYYFRAHHNKVFMEIIRDLVCSNEAGNITSRGYGTYEEYLSEFSKYKNGKYVIKPDAGTRSKGVRLMTTIKQKLRFPFSASRTFTFHNLRWAFSKLTTGKPFVRQSNNRKKFIIQNFIEDLKGDYRIIIYGKKYYALYRKNRDNDFRASGSGNLNFNIKLPDGLLDYAQLIYQKFNVPFVSLDIGYKDGSFFLFEFQFVCLGQYVVEKSTWYYKNSDAGWKKVRENPNVEREIAVSVAEFVKKK